MKRECILNKEFISEDDLKKLNLEFIGFEKGSNKWSLVYKDADNTYLLYQRGHQGGGFDTLYKCNKNENIEIENNSDNGILYRVQSKEPYKFKRLTKEDLEKVLLQLQQEFLKPQTYTLQFGKFLISGTNYNEVSKKWFELYEESQLKKEIQNETN